MNLNILLTQATERAGLPSDRQLAKALGCSSATVAHMRLGYMKPGADLLRRICEMAGADVEAHLIEWAEDRAEQPETKAIYQRLRQMLERAAVVLIIVALAYFSDGTDHAQAAMFGISTVYYGKSLLAFLRWIQGLVNTRPASVCATAGG